MSIDWNLVTVEHVRQACESYDNRTALPGREARTTFLIFNGKSYPAKFIRGLAYRIAAGIELDPSRDYSGGAETARFFDTLGLTTSNSAVASAIQPPTPPQPQAPLQKPRKFEPQKQAIFDLLTQRFGGVECEADFPWLIVPRVSELPPPLDRIFQSLKSMRGHSEFITAGRSLRCDFYIPQARLIVEYDERQHFTLQRATTLDLYPSDITLEFDRQEWIKTCHSFRASDPNPPHRDEQRAFYDSLRDIMAARNGFRLLRFRQGGLDWTQSDAETKLSSAVATHTSDIRRIALVTHDYNEADPSGRYDYSAYFERINKVCDAHGCDTILYSLYTWDTSAQQPRNYDSVFSSLTNVQRVILEVYPEFWKYDHVEVWQHGVPTPRIIHQRFATSAASRVKKRQFLDDLASRQVSNALLMLCGETNIASLIRGSDEFYDPFDFADRLEKTNARIILNPIHDYMRRYEMREKRRYYSRGGRFVVSVWNRGKGSESWLPWTVFHDGEEMTDRVREVETPVAERRDIRIGILDVC